MSTLQFIVCSILTSTASAFSHGQEHVCEGDNLTLSCADSPNTTLYIICANFGRTSITTCNDDQATSTDCLGSDSLSRAKGLCQNYVSCTLSASNTVFGDPCKGVSKYLEIGYVCREPETLTYECHHWTYEDKSKFWINCTFEPNLQNSTCEDHPGYIYTQGNQTLAPGCRSGCDCCKPTGSGSYQCHDWTYEDKAKFYVNCSHHPELERPTCESYPGFIYANGNTTLAPGCGNCSCCKPTASNYVCPTRSSTTFSTSIETTTLEITLATSSTGSTTQGPIVIHDTASFFDDPTNIAVVSTAAGVVGLGAMFVTGYMIVSHGSKITSLCAKTTTSVRPT